MALKKRLSSRKHIAKVKKAAKKSARKIIKRILKKRPAKKKSVKRRPILKRKKTLKKREPVAKKSRKTAKKSPKQEGTLIGLITHYFPHVQAAVIKLKEPLSMGNTVKIKGHTTDLAQVVTSMQIDRIDISSAKKGDEIGLQVSSRVRQGDKVYKI
jgi:putative protease